MQILLRSSDFGMKKWVIIKRGVDMKEKLEEKSKIIKTSKEYKRTVIEEKDREWTKN